MNKAAPKMCNLWKMLIIGFLIYGSSSANSNLEIPSDVNWNNFVAQEDIRIFEDLIKTVSLNSILNKIFFIT